MKWGEAMRYADEIYANIDRNSKIFVAGHKGLLGSALVRVLRDYGFKNVLVSDRATYDLENQVDTFEFFNAWLPDYVFLAAAKVGGILSNSKTPADFILSNLKIQTNVMEAALMYKVKKLVFFGSSCIYPKYARQPIYEESLLTAPLEDSNFAYAIAKIAGVKTCEAIMRQHNIPFISLMPPSLYGPNDNYDLARSHVLAAFIRRFHEGKVNKAKKVTLWGTGNVLREFLYSYDIAEAALLCLSIYNENKPLNIGSSSEISVRELASLVKKIVGFEGDIEWDVSMPEGTPRKLLDSSKIQKLGWSPNIPLKEGIEMAYGDFLATGAISRSKGVA